MLRTQKIEENGTGYLVLVGQLDHTIGTIEREALACYTFRPIQLGSYSASFLTSLAELVATVNKSEEESLRRSIDPAVN